MIPCHCSATGASKFHWTSFSWLANVVQRRGSVCHGWWNEKKHMDGRDGGEIGSIKLLAFSLSSFKLTFLWCACMVPGSIPLWRRVAFVYLYESQEWWVNLSDPFTHVLFPFWFGEQKTQLWFVLTLGQPRWPAGKGIIWRCNLQYL